MDTLYEMMKLLRAARVLAGLSQAELAKRAGISRQMLVRIEKTDGKGVSVASLQSIRTALEACGIEFIPATEGRGPGIASRRETASSLVRIP